jgi:hypothetical protein
MTTLAFESPLAPTETALLDYLADGRWHPYSRAVEAAVRVALAEEPERCRFVGNEAFDSQRDSIVALRDSGVIGFIGKRAERFGADVLVRRLVSSLKTVDGELVLAIEVLEEGDAPSRIRFAAEDLASAWREHRVTSGGEVVLERVGQPQTRIKDVVFGGIPESQGWRLAPLRTFSLAHFTSMQALDLYEFRQLVPSTYTVRADPENTYRVFAPPTDAETLAATVNAACAELGVETHALKVEPSVRRRDLSELPSGFLADLCQHYVRLATGRLMKRSSSTLASLGMDREELGAQVSLWVLEAAAAYDPAASHFGQYLLGKLPNRLLDLVRERRGGRYASDLAAGHRRAALELVETLGRAPSLEEVAAHLGVTVRRAAAMSRAADTLQALATPAALDDIVTESAQPLDGHAIQGDTADRLVADDALAAATRALVEVCVPAEAPAGRKPALNLLALVSYYREHVGGERRVAVAAGLGIDDRTLAAAVRRADGRLSTLVAAMGMEA